jgi:hypothetical protein
MTQKAWLTTISKEFYNYQKRLMFDYYLYQMI